MAVYIHIDWYN